eukprot:Colp12_sorted_trinity150504_noHs@19543
MRSIVALCALLLLGAACAHPHGDHSQFENADSSEIYKLYLKEKQGVLNEADSAILFPTRYVFNVEDVPLGFRDEFHAPLPGQSNVDFHPVLKKKPNPAAPLVYYSWHIHSYFWGGGENPNSTARAMKFRSEFMDYFNATLCPDSCFMGSHFENDVCNGICVWEPFTTVDGPHVLPQWGVYLPNNLFSETIRWMTANHGEFSVLFHPNTGEMIGDHDPKQRAIWISQQMPLDLEFLTWLQCKWFHNHCPSQ